MTRWARGEYHVLHSICALHWRANAARLYASVAPEVRHTAPSVMEGDNAKTGMIKRDAVASSVT
jgi:hypothetical protein